MGLEEQRFLLVLLPCCHLQGDIQMCVSALIVLGDKIRHKIDSQTQEQWLMSYIGRSEVPTLSTSYSN